jgi:hypothetical protein
MHQDLTRCIKLSFAKECIVSLLASLIEEADGERVQAQDTRLFVLIDGTPARICFIKRVLHSESA